jgi:hypothetical protein
MARIFSITVLLFLITSLSFAAADLEITTLKGTPGEDFGIEFEIRNHGPDAANHAGCNLYFYSNERLVLSQAVNLMPLTSGASRKEQLTIALPDQTITTVKVEVFDSEQPDLQPSTNFLQMNIKPPDLRKADLQIVEVKIEDPKEKGKGGFLVRLRNNGPDKIPVSRLTVELEVFGQPIAQADRRVERLDAGAEVEIRVQIPNAPVITSTNGSLSLRWSAEVDDSDSTNNMYKLAIPLPLRMPDLLTLRSNIDRQGILTFTIHNKGNARAPASVTALYINGALVERFNTNEMAPRGSQQFRFHAMKLSSQDKIAIVADFNADVQESSEENNRFTAP